MIFGQTKMELKVGIFVFIGFIILAIFVLSIGDFKTAATGYEINFLFNFANGVKVGAPVRFAGVDVGAVKEIKFILAPNEDKTQVKITGYVNRAVKVPADSSVWVNTLGLLGEKYIEIMPGKNYSNPLLPSQSLVGVDPIPMQEVTVLAKDIAQHLDETIVKIKNGEGTIGKLLYDDKIYKELEALVTDIRKHPWKLFWKTKEKPEKK
jgi:phospholipid/cholesterol/gamma-HCH transport system substrate-binding protein